ncbi:MAG: hypothetical protein R3F49_08770 [Planctomycetota bacterium]
MSCAPLSRVMAALVAIAALSVGAHARQELRGTEDVSASVHSPWPEALARGYAPVFFELRNDGERAVDVDVFVEPQFRYPNSVSVAARSQVALGAGEKRQLELLAPCYRVTQTSFGAGLRVGRSTTSTSLITASGVPEPQDRFLAWVTPKPLAAGSVERMAKELTDSDPALVGVGPSPHMGSLRVFSGSSRTPEWFVFEVVAPWIPSRAAAWSGIDAVVLDMRAASFSLAPARLDPLVSYARQGGLLVVLGDRASVERIVGEDDRMTDAAQKGFGVDGAAWPFGFGHVAWLPDAAGELTEPLDRAAIAALAAEAHVVDPSAGSYQVGTGAGLAHNDNLEIPGLGQVPMHLFAVILLVFAVLIGPVNFLVLKRLQRPGLLLVTIPVISLFATLGIVGFGILRQGLDLKGAAHSLTLLDQRNGHAVTFTRMALMPGLATDDLRPSRGTTVHPTTYDEGVTRELTVRHGEGLTLAGGWAPVRSVSNLLVSSDAVSRARIELKRTPAGIEVFNGLEATLQALTLRDAEGRLYSLSGDATLAPGARATAAPAGAGAALLDARGRFSAQPELGALRERVLDGPAMYIARLASNPYIDWLGLDPNLREQEHILQGVLPLDEADWSK